MANLKEQDKWEDGVYQIEENDPVLGGENGVTNRPIKQLANRTFWLKKALELLGKKSAPKDLTASSVSVVDADGHTHKLPIGTTFEKGVVKLNSQVSNNSEQDAATPKAVKAAYDNGIEAKTAAEAAQRTANDGVSKANAAQTSANAAQRTADDGVLKAKAAQTSADAAQRTANDGVSKAKAAQTSADAAQRTANDGVSKANAAQTSANAAQRTADDGVLKAKAAQTSADAAQRTANDGVSKAKAAQTSADAAQRTANDGVSRANAAQRTANDANNNANTRQLKSELVGEVAFFACSTPPSGWLKANGAAVSRTTYAALFAAIGTTFGAGDGRTTFNLPDLRGEFLRCLDDGRNIDRGRRLGSAQGDAIRNITGKLDGSAMGSGNQVLEGKMIASGAIGTTYQQRQWSGDQGGWGEQSVSFDFDASRVVPTASENRPRNVALLACIKY